MFHPSSSSQPAEVFRKDLISAMKLPDSHQLLPDNYWVIQDQWKQEWEKGVQVPVDDTSINDPQFFEVRMIDSGTFKLPNEFIKCYSGTEEQMRQAEDRQKEIEATCQYDLDEVDIQWLHIVNREREDMGETTIDELTMEKIIEQCEIQCQKNIEHAIQTEEGLGIEYDEDICCAVCRAPDSEEGNEMVFCDKCDICVHQACYGVMKIPEGSWMCRVCALGLQPECILCGKKGGAMKSTRSGTKWAHVNCALWIPEVSIGDVDRMEPITKIAQIPASRWSLICNLCRERTGACIQCSVKTCKIAYHVTCGVENNLEMEQVLDENKEVKFRSLCLKHTNSRKGSSSDGQVKSSSRKKSSEEERANARAMRIQRVTEDFQKYVKKKEVVIILGFKDDAEIVDLVFEYWKLKRKSGFNKPLLNFPRDDDKDKNSEEYNLHARMKMFVHLRQDLERVRNLCYMVQKREKLSRQMMRLREGLFKKQCEFFNGNLTRMSEEEVDWAARAGEISARVPYPMSEDVILNKWLSIPSDGPKMLFDDDEDDTTEEDSDLELEAKKEREKKKREKAAARKKKEAEATARLKEKLAQVKGPVSSNTRGVKHRRVSSMDGKEIYEDEIRSRKGGTPSSRLSDESSKSPSTDKELVNGELSREDTPERKPKPKKPTAGAKKGEMVSPERGDGKRVNGGKEDSKTVKAKSSVRGPKSDKLKEKQREKTSSDKHREKTSSGEKPEHKTEKKAVPKKEKLNSINNHRMNHKTPLKRKNIANNNREKDLKHSINKKDRKFFKSPNKEKDSFVNKRRISNSDENSVNNHIIKEDEKVHFLGQGLEVRGEWTYWQTSEQRKVQSEKEVRHDEDKNAAEFLLQELGDKTLLPLTPFEEGHAKSLNQDFMQRHTEDQNAADFLSFGNFDGKTSSPDLKNKSTPLTGGMKKGQEMLAAQRLLNGLNGNIADWKGENLFGPKSGKMENRTEEISQKKPCDAKSRKTQHQENTGTGSMKKKDSGTLDKSKQKSKTSQSNNDSGKSPKGAKGSEAEKSTKKHNRDSSHKEHKDPDKKKERTHSGEAKKSDSKKERTLSNHDRQKPDSNKASAQQEVYRENGRKEPHERESTARKSDKHKIKSPDHSHAELAKGKCGGREERRQSTEHNEKKHHQHRDKEQFKSPKEVECNKSIEKGQRRHSHEKDKSQVRTDSHGKGRTDSRDSFESRDRDKGKSSASRKSSMERVPTRDEGKRNVSIERGERTSSKVSNRKSVERNDHENMTRKNQKRQQKSGSSEPLSPSGDVIREKRRPSSKEEKTPILPAEKRGRPAKKDKQSSRRPSTEQKFDERRKNRSASPVSKENSSRERNSKERIALDKKGRSRERNRSSVQLSREPSEDESNNRSPSPPSSKNIRRDKSSSERASIQRGRSRERNLSTQSSRDPSVDDTLDERNFSRSPSPVADKRRVKNSKTKSPNERKSRPKERNQSTQSSREPSVQDTLDESTNSQSPSPMSDQNETRGRSGRAAVDRRGRSTEGNHSRHSSMEMNHSTQSSREPSVEERHVARKKRSSSPVPDKNERRKESPRGRALAEGRDSLKERNRSTQSSREPSVQDKMDERRRKRSSSPVPDTAQSMARGRSSSAKSPLGRRAESKGRNRPIQSRLSESDEDSSSAEQQTSIFDIPEIDESSQEDKDTNPPASIFDLDPSEEEVFQKGHRRSSRRPSSASSDHGSQADAELSDDTDIVRPRTKRKRKALSHMRSDSVRNASRKATSLRGRIPRRRGSLSSDRSSMVDSMDESVERRPQLLKPLDRPPTPTLAREVLAGRDERKSSLENESVIGKLNDSTEKVISKDTSDIAMLDPTKAKRTGSVTLGKIPDGHQRRESTSDKQSEKNMTTRMRSVHKESVPTRPTDGKEASSRENISSRSSVSIPELALQPLTSPKDKNASTSGNASRVSSFGEANSHEPPNVTETEQVALARGGGCSAKQTVAETLEPVLEGDNVLRGGSLSERSTISKDLIAQEQSVGEQELPAHPYSTLTSSKNTISAPQYEESETTFNGNIESCTSGGKGLVAHPTIGKNQPSSSIQSGIPASHVERGNYELPKTILPETPALEDMPPLGPPEGICLAELWANQKTALEKIADMVPEALPNVDLPPPVLEPSIPQLIEPEVSSLFSLNHDMGDAKFLMPFNREIAPNARKGVDSLNVSLDGKKHNDSQTKSVMRPSYPEWEERRDSFIPGGALHSSEKQAQPLSMFQAEFADIPIAAKPHETGLYGLNTALNQTLFPEAANEEKSDAPNIEDIINNHLAAPRDVQSDHFTEKHPITLPPPQQQQENVTRWVPDEPHGIAASKAIGLRRKSAPGMVQEQPPGLPALRRNNSLLSFPPNQVNFPVNNMAMFSSLMSKGNQGNLWDMASKDARLPTSGVDMWEPPSKDGRVPQGNGWDVPPLLGNKQLMESLSVADKPSATTQNLFSGENTDGTNTFTRPDPTPHKSDGSWRDILDNMPKDSGQFGWNPADLPEFVAPRPPTLVSTFSQFNNFAGESSGFVPKVSEHIQKETVVPEAAVPTEKESISSEVKESTGPVVEPQAVKDKVDTVSEGAQAVTTSATDIATEKNVEKVQPTADKSNLLPIPVDKSSQPTIPENGIYFHKKLSRSLAQRRRDVRCSTSTEPKESQEKPVDASSLEDTSNQSKQQDNLAGITAQKTDSVTDLGPSKTSSIVTPKEDSKEDASVTEGSAKTSKEPSAAGKSSNQDDNKNEGERFSRRLRDRKKTPKPGEAGENAETKSKSGKEKVDENRNITAEKAKCPSDKDAKKVKFAPKAAGSTKDEKIELKGDTSQTTPPVLQTPVEKKELRATPARDKKLEPKANSATKILSARRKQLKSISVLSPKKEDANPKGLAKRQLLAKEFTKHIRGSPVKHGRDSRKRPTPPGKKKISTLGRSKRQKMGDKTNALELKTGGGVFDFTSDEDAEDSVPIILPISPRVLLTDVIKSQNTEEKKAQNAKPQAEKPSEHSQPTKPNKEDELIPMDVDVSETAQPNPARVLPASKDPKEITENTCQSKTVTKRNELSSPERKTNPRTNRRLRVSVSEKEGDDSGQGPRRRSSRVQAKEEEEAAAKAEEEAKERGPPNERRASLRTRKKDAQPTNHDREVEEKLGEVDEKGPPLQQEEGPGKKETNKFSNADILPSVDVSPPAKKDKSLSPEKDGGATAEAARDHVGSVALSDNVVEQEEEPLAKLKEKLIAETAGEASVKNSTQDSGETPEIKMDSAPESSSLALEEDTKDKSSSSPTDLKIEGADGKLVIRNWGLFANLRKKKKKKKKRPLHKDGYRSLFVSESSGGPKNGLKLKIKTIDHYFKPMPQTTATTVEESKPGSLTENPGGEPKVHTPIKLRIPKSCLSASYKPTKPKKTKKGVSEETVGSPEVTANGSTRDEKTLDLTTVDEQPLQPKAGDNMNPDEQPPGRVNKEQQEESPSSKCDVKEQKNEGRELGTNVSEQKQEEISKSEMNRSEQEKLPLDGAMAAERKESEHATEKLGGISLASKESVLETEIADTASKDELGGIGLDQEERKQKEMQSDSKPEESGSDVTSKRITSHMDNDLREESPTLTVDKKNDDQSLMAIQEEVGPLTLLQEKAKTVLTLCKDQKKMFNRPEPKKATAMDVFDFDDDPIDDFPSPVMTSKVRVSRELNQSTSSVVMSSPFEGLSPKAGVGGKRERSLASFFRQSDLSDDSTGIGPKKQRKVAVPLTPGNSVALTSDKLEFLESMGT